MIAVMLIIFCVVSGAWVFIEGRRGRKAFEKAMEALPKMIALGLALVERRLKNDSH
jgi:hypothetical protein